ncbi:MAG: hypothetical protein ABI600_15785 [Luteolibacter sp.]
MMKSLLLLPLLGLVFIATSCRTATPLDPMTMKPSCKCLPKNMHPHDPCGEVIGTK